MVETGAIEMCHLSRMVAKLAVMALVLYVRSEYLGPIGMPLGPARWVPGPGHSSWRTYISLSVHERLIVRPR